MSFTAPQAPHAVLGLLQPALLSRGFSSDAGEKGSDYEELSYAGPTADCAALIVAWARPTGSLVNIRYQATCPR